MHMSCDLGCFVENMFCTNLHGEKFSQQLFPCRENEENNQV